MKRRYGNRPLSLRAVLALSLLTLLLCGMAMAAYAGPPVTFTTNTTIDTGVTTYDGRDIIVSGCTVTINGMHGFNSLLVQNSGLVTHAAGLIGGMNLTIATNCTINVRSAISADGQGYAGGYGILPAGGPGAGASDTSGNRGGGASYGGEGVSGPNNPAGQTYDDLTLAMPTDLGSGGGTGNQDGNGGGNGGGAIRMIVNGTFQIDGSLSANGYGPSSGGGAGSGGSVWLTVGTLTGAGSISALGGSTDYSSSPGGGGRIAIQYTVNNFAQYLSWSFKISASGGYCITGYFGQYTGQGGAGTILMQGPGQAYGDLWVHNANNPVAATPLADPLTFDNIYIWAHGWLAPVPGNPLILNVTNNADIAAAAYLSANGRGYGGGYGALPASGPGAGGSDVSGQGGGGGGYGGRGANGNGRAGYGGTTYDTQSYKTPTDLGSGGGSGDVGNNGGGTGGGAIQLTVHNTLQVDGYLSADGAGGGGSWGGGGSGGSLWIVCNALSSAGGGYITANGGPGGTYYFGGGGGGGGGGQIALYYANTNGIGSVFNGTLVANGGGGWQGGANATPYTQQTVNVAVQSLVFSPTTLAGGQMSYGTVTLNASAPTDVSMALTSGNPAILTMPASLTISAGATSASFTVTASSVSGKAQTVLITGALGGATASATLTVTPWFSSLKTNPASACSGTTVTVALTLNTAAPAGGLKVNLASNDPTVTVPTSITVAAGTTTKTFSVTVNTVSTAKPITLTASHLTESATATLYVNPGAVQVKTITVAPGSVLGGNVASGVVTLTAKAPTGGELVALASSDSAVTLPAYIAVPAGKTSASFSISTKAVTAPKSVIITAALGVTKMTTLTVRMPGISSLTLLPSEVSSGDTPIGVVTLEAPCPSPVTVTIISDNPAALPDMTLIIPAGQTQGTFNIDTDTVTSQTFATITVRANGLGKSQVLTIDP